MGRVCSLDHKRDYVTISKQCLEIFQRNSDEFLRRFITVNETWIYYFTSETKEQSKQWTSSDELAPKTVKSAGKMMATVFWDARGIIHIDYLSLKQTINGDYAALDRFSNILKKKTSLFNKEVLFQNNAWVHTCPAPFAKFNEFRYELLLHLVYSPDLAPYFCFQT
ncbi:PREDICTED: histone-lysine N-methyltransferase SETMAR-like [Atta cephalotes]|uniref:Mariner Mos1 transposase n=1 Tax=Atta cephalotes TaxID=12957 RepID=A0A158NXG0_ATTCE|nr:PREDICTED: histone-lysine N-methyltransferase SETMAR-like [Atta cephalotes]